ncbi:PilW family protein [Candidatus Omnitrophota bacterium]
MILKIRRTPNSGFTLLEVVLALAVSVVIISAVTMAFQVSLKSSRSTFSKNEALQHARLAMNKIVRDLRYAVKIKVFPTDLLGFYTRTRVNDDWNAEVIQYQRNGDFLERSVDGGAPTIIAGVGAGDVRVSILQTILLKSDGSNGLTSTGDVNDPVLAVEVTLGVIDKFGKEVRLISTARLMNV